MHAPDNIGAARHVGPSEIQRGPTFGDGPHAALRKLSHICIWSPTSGQHISSMQFSSLDLTSFKV